MDDREKRHRADEAARLVSEPLLVGALETIRMETLVALASVDPTNPTKITHLQAKAQVCLDIVLELQAAIVAAPADQPEK